MFGSVQSWLLCMPAPHVISGYHMGQHRSRCWPLACTECDEESLESLGEGNNLTCLLLKGHSGCCVENR